MTSDANIYWTFKKDSQYQRTICLFPVCLWISMFSSHTRSQRGGKSTFGSAKRSHGRRLGQLHRDIYQRLPTFTLVNLLWNGFRQKFTESINIFGVVPSKLTSMQCSRDIRHLSKRLERPFKKARAVEK